MTIADLYAFISRHPLAVQASVSAEGAPQAAVVGMAVSPDLELVFDTVDGTRKCMNLRRDPRIAVVIGWDLKEACTVQIEGVADEPRGPALGRLRKLYLDRFPDGVRRQAWTGITYFRITPTWIRWSDFRSAEPTIVEIDPRAT